MSPVTDQDLVAVCQTCQQPIDAGTGYLWVKGQDFADREQAIRAWEEEHVDPQKAAGVLITHDLMTLTTFPDTVRWRASHEACDNLDAARHTIDAERLRTWADLVYWTGHLMTTKRWLDDTDWGRMLANIHRNTDMRLRSHQHAPGVASDA
jgi:hypothetical protein